MLPSVRSGVVKTFRWQTLAIPITDQREPNPNVPPLVADAFVSHARQRNVTLAFETESLVTLFNASLDADLFADTKTHVSVPKLDDEFDLKSAAAAYLGQTLALQHNGNWTGYFAMDSGTNFYTATLSFGDFSLNPICWLSYRLTNGAGEGTVSDWLDRVLPSIAARKDLTPQTGFIDDIY